MATSSLDHDTYADVSKIWKILTHQLLQYTNDTQWWYHSIKKRCKNSTKSKMVRSDLHCISCGFVQQQTGLGHTKKPKKWGCLFVCSFGFVCVCVVSLGEKTKNYDILSQKKSSESNLLDTVNTVPPSCIPGISITNSNGAEKKIQKKISDQPQPWRSNKIWSSAWINPKKSRWCLSRKLLLYTRFWRNRFPRIQAVFFSGGKRFPAVFLFLLVLSALTSRKCGGLRISKGTRTIPFPSVPGRRLHGARGVG